VASALAIGAVAAAPATSWAQSASSHSVVLHPGQSIQAAIDAAAPGTTIVLTSGTYRGNLTITKTVSLRGVGSVLIAPAATFTHNACTDDPDLPPQANGQPPVTGICIGDITPAEQIITTVADVALSGLEVRGFDGGGLFAAGTAGLTVDNVEIDHNGDFGAIADLSDHVTFRADRVHDNANGGLHFAADQVVVAIANRSYRNNGEGLLLLDSSRARLEANRLTGNCAGLVAVDTGYPGGVDDLRITANTIQGNDRYCPGQDGPGGKPAEGGLGVALAGTTNTVVSGNRITDNALAALPAGAQPPFVQGGLALLDSTGFGGRAPANNRIVGNTSQGNTPLDVITDGSGTGNVFLGNNCDTASTPGICN